MRIPLRNLVVIKIRTQTPPLTPTPARKMGTRSDLGAEHSSQNPTVFTSLPDLVRRLKLMMIAQPNAPEELHVRQH